MNFEKFESLGVLKKGVIQPLFLKTMYKDKEALEILKGYPGDSPKEQLYCMMNGIGEKPLCYCGKKVKFVNTTNGYRKYCSSSCSNKSLLTKEKYKKHMLKNYGVEHYSQTQEYKDKFKKTSLERYGVDNPNKLKSIKRRKEETFLKNWGYKNISQVPSVKQKKSEIFIKKFYKTLKEGRLKGEVEPLFLLKDYGGIEKKYDWKCNKCQTVFQDHIKYGKIPLCPTCFGTSGVSKVEKEIVDWLKSLGLSPVENSRQIIPPKEIDIYFPDKNLAIEVNGVYWHGERSKGKNYHLDKMKKCNEQGIKLIQIWDIEWKEKQDIIKSIILSALNLKIQKIYARKTSVKEISFKEAKDFLKENHIQGSVPSSINLGLFYKGNLLSVLSFAKSRFDKKYEWEITRFSNKTNYRVTGGFSKLLNYFRKKHKGSIVTYSDARMFDGKVYEISKFKRIGLTPPGYKYAALNKHIKLESRFNYQKHKIKNKNPDLSEWENMQLRGYDRVWDCGNWKFILE